MDRLKTDKKMIKKKHTYLGRLMALMLLITTSACDRGMLDAVPTDRLSESVFWQSQADAELAVNSLYNDLDGTEIFFLDALTDIGHVNQPFAVDAYIALGTYDALNTRIYNTWSDAYVGIGAANYFLANVDRIENITDNNTFLRYKGEARVLRAYQYIKLAYLFGAVPLLKGPLTLEESRQATRTPLDEIYDFVDTELSEAAGWLPEAYSGTNVGRVTKWAAIALRARANLYAGRYRQAAEAAGEIIQSGDFSLYSRYENLFSYTAENNGEVILDKQFVSPNFVHNSFYLLAPYSQQNSQSTYVPTKVLADTYETADGKAIDDADSGYDADNPYENRDPRLHFSIFLDGDILPSGIAFSPAPNSGTSDAIGSTYIASTTGFNVKKYVNAQDFANPSRSGINIILLRYAEVLLTYAEAKIELDEIDASVYEAINTVRNSRSDVQLPALPVGLIQDDLREAVRRERTVELAFEGLHLADVRRWRTAETVIPGNVYGITYRNADGTTSVVEAASESRVFNASRHYLWPIPQRERDLNPDLEQNPGW